MKLIKEEITNRVIKEIDSVTTYNTIVLTFISDKNYSSYNFTKPNADYYYKREEKNHFKVKKNITKNKLNKVNWSISLNILNGKNVIYGKNIETLEKLYKNYLRKNKIKRINDTIS